MAEKKRLFRIWDKKYESYVSGNKNKTTWNSIGWVTSKIEDECRGHGRYYSNSNLRRNPDEFEVREFKLVLENTIDGGDLFREKKEIERIKKEGVKKYEAAANEVKKIVPNLEVSSIKDFYQKGIFAENINQKLKPLIQVLSDNYRHISK